MPEEQEVIDLQPATPKDILDDSGDVGSQGQWQCLRHPAFALANERVPRAYSGGFHTDSQLAVFWFGARHVCDLNYFWGSVFENSRRFHSSHRCFNAFTSPAAVDLLGGRLLP